MGVSPVVWSDRSQYQEPYSERRSQGLKLVDLQSNFLTNGWVIPKQPKRLKYNFNRQTNIIKIALF